MIRKDYIPSKEGDIIPWTENFITVANANLTTLGLIETDITAIATKKVDFTTKLNNAIAKQAESKAATESKNISKDDLVTNIRVLAKQIQARPGVPNNLKEQLGLTVPNPTPTPLQPVTPTELSAKINTSGHAQIKWNRNGNPSGTIFLIETSNNYSTGWQITGSTTKTTYITPLTLQLGSNYIRVKAQKGELTSEPSNVIII